MFFLSRKFPPINSGSAVRSLGAGIAVKWGYFGSLELLWPPSGKMLLMHFPRNTPELQLPLVFCIVRQLIVPKKQGCEKPWVFGILPMGSGFLPKTQGFCQKPRVFGGFLGFCYILIQSDTSEVQFIHAITESHSFKTRKQISATYKPNLRAYKWLISETLSSQLDLVKYNHRANVY